MSLCTSFYLFSSFLHFLLLLLNHIQLLEEINILARIKCLVLIIVSVCTILNIFRFQIDLLVLSLTGIGYSLDWTFQISQVGRIS